jgi:transposase
MFISRPVRFQCREVKLSGYTQFCESYRRFARQLKRSMRQIHRAGEKLFIDYAGPTMG